MELALRLKLSILALSLQSQFFLPQYFELFKRRYQTRTHACAFVLRDLDSDHSDEIPVIVTKTYLLFFKIITESPKHTSPYNTIRAVRKCFSDCKYPFLYNNQVPDEKKILIKCIC